MEGIMQKIDQIWVFPIGDCRRVKIRGWAFLKEDMEERVVLSQKKFMEHAELLVEDRMDVATKYMQYGDKVECGFVCQFDYSADVNKNEKVELYLENVETGSREKFFSKSIAQLEKYLFTPDVKYRIENVTYMLGKMMVTGWAYASTGYGVTARPLIQVKDRSQKLMESKISDVERLDVNQITGQPEVQGELGFRLEWTARENESYQLIFGEGDCQKQITVSETGVKKASYYAKKVVKRGMNGVKRVLKIGHNSYSAWEKSHRVTEAELLKQQETVFDDMPKISIVVPAYRTPEKFLREMIDSVREQSYQNWELCIADGSMDGSICGVLAEYARMDARVKYVELEENYGISGNTNGALKIATGDYISLLDHDDVLTKDALYEVVKCINETGADVLYTDEDKVTMDLKEYFEPHFKSDFSLDLIRSCNYICHFFVVKKEILEQVGEFREECNGSQDYDFILRCTTAAQHVAHIPKILYHWRCHPNSTAGDPQSKMYCYEAGKRSLELTMEENQVKGAEVSIERHFGYYRVLYPVPKAAKTAIIILPYGEKDNIEKTIASVEKYTAKGRYEICLAKEKISAAAAFNDAAAHTDAEYLVFLQAGMTVMQEGWLDILLGNCQRTEVGAVAAPVLVKGKYIAHSGKILGLGDAICRDMFENRMASDAGYAGRMLAQQNVRAVSWKGMMVQKEQFLQMGGFDERLQNNYEDVDLCLKLQEQGKLIVYTPYTSYAMERYMAREEQEENAEDAACIREKWGEILAKEDPYYNRNFDKKGETFTLPF